jgi:hypothetical protein
MEQPHMEDIAGIGSSSNMPEASAESKAGTGAEPGETTTAVLGIGEHGVIRLITPPTSF